jgi:hypothetical protein
MYFGFILRVFATIVENLKENLPRKNFNQPTTLTMTYEFDRFILMYPMTRTEIKSITDGLKNHTASGLDDCSSKMLKKLSDDLSRSLSEQSTSQCEMGSSLLALKQLVLWLFIRAETN